MTYIRGYIDPDTGQLREEIVDGTPSADVTALRSKIEKATTLAGLRSAMLDVLDATIPTPSE